MTTESIAEALDRWGKAPKIAELSSLLVDTSKAKKLRHGMQESLMLFTDYVLSKKVSARDLFGERLKKFGIREHVASGKDDERSRCLTDGSQCLAVFLTEDGFVDFLTAYGVDAPRKILNAISETFGTGDLQRAPATISGLMNDAEAGGPC